MTAWKTFFNFLFIKPFLKKNRLIQQMPFVRGKLTENEPLYKKNWFGVGGAAQVYFEPADVSDLAFFRQNMPSVPLQILGAGSNVLIRDGGIPGVTVHLGRAFANITANGDFLSCGASTGVMEVARAALKNSLSGFEFLCGIPGSVGGAVRMNAGAYGSQIQDCLHSLTVVTQEGEIRVLNTEELRNAFAYRTCLLPQQWIFVLAVFKGKKAADASVIREKIEINSQKRRQGQPAGVRTAGSAFKNPPGMSAWQLIDRAGMRGAKIGGAEVSQKHCNFLINTGHASAKDIETLGEKIREKVLQKEGIRLEWEIKRMGVEK